jgi:hypothetical protein
VGKEGWDVGSTVGMEGNGVGTNKGLIEGDLVG